MITKGSIMPETRTLRCETLLSENWRAYAALGHCSRCTSADWYDTIRYDILFALKNWQASCQF